MINEDVGICRDCKAGAHENCKMVLGSYRGGMAFCNCKCKPAPADEMSLGAPPGAFDKLDDQQRDEFPRHELDPLDHIL